MQMKANDYEFQDIVKMIREWSELTQKDFAKKVNMEYGTITKYESGQRKGSFTAFINICKKNNIEIILKKK